MLSFHDLLRSFVSSRVFSLLLFVRELYKESRKLFPIRAGSDGDNAIETFSRRGWADKINSIQRINGTIYIWKVQN